MKLSVSNIAWDNAELEDHLKLLKDLGCDGVEIAPSCIWKEPVNAADEDVEKLKNLISKYNLQIPAFQALLFTRPDLYIFGDNEKRQDTVRYLKMLIGLAGRLSVRTLIYGSPSSRKVGDKPYNECYQIAIEVFRELAAEAEKYDTIFCIEPLEHSMSDFINTSDEGYRLIQDVGHPNFGLHLDARAMCELKENFQSVFQRYGSIIKHFHVGDPELSPPGYTGRIDHSLIGNALINSNYNGYVSIEMRRGFGNSKEVVKNAVKYVREKYFLSGDTGNAGF
ncbi:hypothetical protein JZK55_12420 [Dissulfurispira thermophila]|uniref:Xylose isomerase-like TIM barrel domain-containing protein n=2 Tax=root TaxID=1 RepID=A0A7G1H0K0_9BACT|nr:sugar phosphate isomerase/epimerase [Dissulfurispira thermophila]BCB96320.1 hypothetical protein JZK55_12420 [Dissulfurispira thermophila]